MATRTVEKVVRYGGAASHIEKYPEAASQSFKSGELVYLVAGKVTVVAANGESILGIAVSDATGVTDADCYVDVLKPNEWIEINISHATPASAVCAQATVGTVGAGIGTTSNKTVAALDATGNKTLKIINRIPRDSATDLYPRVIASIKSTYAQADVVA